MEVLAGVVFAALFALWVVVPSAVRRNRSKKSRLYNWKTAINLVELPARLYRMKVSLVCCLNRFAAAHYTPIRPT